MQKKVAILVVTYNRKKYLDENIQAILKQSYADFDFIICDNASTDGTDIVVQEYAKKDSRINYFNTGANLGGAGGFHYGLRHIYKKEYQYCWIMDDDAIPKENALESLMSVAMQLPENTFSFLASTVLWTDGKPCYMNKMSIEVEKIYDNLECAKRGLIPVTSSSFVGCFVNLHYGRKVGLPIKEFFIYGDDSEYTLRLGECAQGYMDTGSCIIHKMPNNSKLGIAEALPERIERYIYDYRNQVYISRFRKKEKRSRLIMRYARECIKVLVKAKGRKAKRIRIIIKGYCQGRKFEPVIERE